MLKSLIGKECIARILFTLISISSVVGTTYQDVFAIESELLVNYSTNILPVKTQTDTIYVDLTVYLQSISELNEISGQVTTTMGFSMNWNDSQLTWNPMKYGDVLKITLRASQIWTPDLLLANARMTVENVGENSKLTVNHNGTVTWVFMDVFYTVCDIDVTYFPFDIQICHARFITWLYGSQMQFRVSKPEVDLFFFTGHGVFHLLKTDVNASFYASNESYAHALTVTLYLQRLPLFYAINLLAPILLLVLLNSTVFLLPVESGERVGFSVTILLSITVYMTIVADTLPDTSEPACILI